MKQSKILSFLLVLVMLAGPLVFLSTPSHAAANPIYTCLPTCDESDTRFITMAGANLQSLEDASIRIEFATPANAALLNIDIFDGDTSGRWDSDSTPLVFKLWADPLANGAESILLGQWSGTEMPDNAWFDISIPSDPAAQSPSGNYFYHMTVVSTNPGTNYISNFKVRSEHLVSLVPQAFSFISIATALDDVYALYPAWPELTPTTYDGSFDFYAYVPTSVSSFVTWDGDLDHGSYDLSVKDTDDPDTPNEYIPEWVTTNTHEGIAVGANSGTGLPLDDSSLPYIQRSPSVIYTVTAPDGTSFLNSNPSGNIEWEQFRIETNPAIPADYYVESSLSSGIYEIHMEGMDIFNLNAWRFPYDILGVCEALPGQKAVPCKNPYLPFIIGNTVFSDVNGNGIQDPGEAGLPAVTVALFDSAGNPILDANGNPITTITDDQGRYTFNVQGQKIDQYLNDIIFDGVYTVQVASQNFEPGGPLFGMFSTTGGEQQTNTIINANVMTYNFGYTSLKSDLGNTIWMDSNNDGIFTPEAGELAFANVQVTLSVDYNGDGQPDYTTTAVTDAAGIYQFTNLLPGNYTVTTNPATLPGGLNPVYDLDGVASANTTGVSLAAGESNQNVDFGYQPLVAPGTGTIGYWKNHPTAWPVVSITIGNHTYSRAQAITLMGTPGKGDMTYQLFAQLTAAKLNVGLGNQSACIQSAILTADAWMASHPVGSGIKSSNPAWKQIASIHSQLDSYNNGQMCAAHRD